MAGISAIYPYGTYYNYYSSIYNILGTATAGSTGSTTGGAQSLNDIFSQLQLWDYTRSQAVTQQNAYRAQVQGFTTATQSLASSAGAIANLPAAADATKATAAIKTAVADYNKLVQSLQGGNLTTEGRGLLNTLQTAAAVREEDLEAIGIAYNRNSGELTVDSLKLKQAVTTNYAQVRETLGGEYGLGLAMQQIAGAAGQESVSNYVAYNPLATTDYTSQLSGSYLSSYYTAYSQGLLLDLMA